MTNKFNVPLTDEEQERYDYLKALSLQLYPKIATDNIMANMAEYLYIQYAKTGKLPDPPEETEKSEELSDAFDKMRIIEYRTPADAGDTLIRS